MALTETGWKSLVKARVGDPADPDGTDVVTPRLDAIWASNAGYGTRSRRLQYLYTVRDCLLVVAASWRAQITASADGQNVSWSEKLANAMKLADEVGGEITRLEATLAASRGGAAGPITQTVPMPAAVPGAWNDPNAPRTRGVRFPRWW